jgi:tRNA(fMet)-specific endonuclease VapC
MSLYLLDTDILTLFQKGHPVVAKNIINHIGGASWPIVQSTSQPVGVINQPTHVVAITVISVQEQLTGWYTQLGRSKKPDHLALVYLQLETAVRQLAWFNIASFTEQAILRSEQLKRMKLNVGKMDLSIAAIALENKAVVVTRNVRDFQRVPNLTVEDWSV